MPSRAVPPTHRAVFAPLTQPGRAEAVTRIAHMATTMDGGHTTVVGRDTTTIAIRGARVVAMDIISLHWGGVVLLVMGGGSLEGH